MRLKLRVAAMLAAAVTFAPSLANAADFYTIRVDVAGMGTRTARMPNDEIVVRTSYLTSYFEVVVPIGTYFNSNGQQVTQSLGSFNFVEPGTDFQSSIRGGVTSTGFTLFADRPSIRRGPRISFNATGCLPNVSTSGSFSFAINDPFCATTAAYDAAFGNGNFGGDYPEAVTDRISWFGGATKITVTEGFGTPATYGVVSAVILPIPEPASWAMMIVGVGAVGGMARRRRPVAVAA